MASEGFLDWMADMAVEHPNGFAAAISGVFFAGLALLTIVELLGEGGDNMDISGIDRELEKDKEAKERALKERQSQLNFSGDYCEEAEKIVSDLLRQPRLNQVAEDYPGELDRLQADIRRNRAASQESTAVGIAMHLYQRAMDLQMEYQDFDRRWKTAKEQWELRHQRLEEKFENCRILRIPQDPADGAEALELDCDEWCSGALERASRELEPLEQSEDSTIRDLNRLSEQAEELSARIDQIVYQAMGNFHSSEQRVMTSEIVMDALERRGWREKDYRFSTDGDDNERLNDLILSMVNPVGDQLKFIFRRGDHQMVADEIHVQDLMEMTMELKGVYTRESQQTLFGTIVQALLEHNVDLRNSRQDVKGVT